MAAVNPLERYRLRHQPAALALCEAGVAKIPPIHDADHRDCCVRHGVDPNWEPEQDGTAHLWPARTDRANDAW